ncbi:MAG: hypothetical protein CMF25_04270 [Kangiellaceae bacterium]|jgi:hypothetical protein|nr:hypothetical protein [Kangiellaceae bacterium]|tara:strand:- start:2558 stop:2848 length:291 start_codon:yes stop_codon:yes gene_type:complete
MQNRLTEEAFKQTISSPEKVTEGEPVIDFWEYVELIPEEDYQGHDCSEGIVENVYRMTGNHYEHVLINSNTEKVAMAIVIDLEATKVAGHFLLDLR